MTKLIRATLFALATAFAAVQIQAAPPSKEDAQAIVEKAAALASTSGKEKLLAEVNKENGEFNKGELYVFIYDLQGTMLATPINKHLIGQNNVSKPDVDGKLFRKDIIEIATTKGSGWIDYKTLNPVTSKVEAKTSYVKKHGDVVIIAGAFQK